MKNGFSQAGSSINSVKQRIFIHLLTVILAILFGINNLYSQNQNSIWCFGDSAGMDFRTSPPQTFSTSLDTRGSCVSIADSLGDLLFYANTRATLPGNTTLVWS